MESVEGKSYKAEFLISGLGQLNSPNIPIIEGQEYFKQLQLAGVNVIHKEQKGFVHAFAQFGIIPECRSAIKEACTDLLSF